MGNTTTVTVNILGKDYEVACAISERDALKASARHLDLHMQAIKNSGKVIGLDRVAVMAALNIAHEFIDAQSRRKQTEEQIDMLAEQLRQVLEARQPVETA